ncbi:MAG TPA: GNAT family N-acetyltransferase [Methanoregula sp.]|nr:GNAT family N-acetyltransferase [Methanoregula sp.]
MPEPITIRPVIDSDREAVIRIFNYYAENGYAAYPDQPVTGHFFSYLREGTFSFLVIQAPEGVIGFGLAKPFLPFPAFSRTCSLTYFILPEYARRGLGTLLLARLTSEARAAGITTQVANMASRNEASVRFHARHGFSEGGRLHRVGEKFGEPFDVIWMQREI